VGHAAGDLKAWRELGLR